jgi:hypothetical protein
MPLIIITALLDPMVKSYRNPLVVFKSPIENEDSSTKTFLKVVKEVVSTFFDRKTKMATKKRNSKLFIFCFRNIFLVSRQEHSIVDRGVASQFFFAAFLMNKPSRLMTDLNAFYFPTFKIHLHGRFCNSSSH